MFISGVFAIWGTNMPVFLYENYIYNDEDPEEGLFRGAFLVCVSPVVLFWSIYVLTFMPSIDTHWHPIWVQFGRHEECQTRRPTPPPLPGRDVQTCKYHPGKHHIYGSSGELPTRCIKSNLYSYIQARFCLSSKWTWGNKDNNFNYLMFYQAILWKFADPEDPWVQDTIARWNE